MPPKRKRSSIATTSITENQAILPPSATKSKAPVPPKRQTYRRGNVDTNPDQNSDIIDGKTALRASPDADEKGEALNIKAVNNGLPPDVVPRRNKSVKVEEDAEEDSLSVKKVKKSPTKSSVAAKKGADEIKAFKAEQAAKKTRDSAEGVKGDPNGNEDVVEDIDVMKKEAGRPPPVNSHYLPLPWKGRLGYACLNTYLRFSNPPVFSSRTCRIASILEHRHPLKDPSQPEHATKNRPDKTKPASIERGQKYVEELGLANARDIVKMLRWNDKYGIKFMRLSSEMFPFASHEEYGYQLAPFASEALAEAGRVAAELGHRLSTHPGQFTQLGSPRPDVIKNAIRDLQYHDEMLTLLKLPEQADRNAVSIFHMGGVFGDKDATLDRFRQNYKTLSPSIKQRLVLENDDVSWSVHDLLPVCEELNIPLCLDFHHHNIIFDKTQLREGTLDIMDLYPRIKATWDRKKMRQKMHYSEPCPEAITGRQRRKHNPRPATLPPCPDDMDLMIEAKDKEQAVFELMRTFKLPGYNTFNDIIPYERTDDNKPLPKKTKKKKTKKQISDEIEEFGRELSDEEEEVKSLIPEEDVGMGGSEGRVYWPKGMEEWLRPKKREIKKKNDEGNIEVGDDEDEVMEEMMKIPTPANFAARKAYEAKNRQPLNEDVKQTLGKVENLKDLEDILRRVRKGQKEDEEVTPSSTKKTSGQAKKVDGVKKEKASTSKKKKKIVKKAPTPSDVGEEEEEEEDLSMPDLSDDEEVSGGGALSLDSVLPGSGGARQSGRTRGKRKSYAEVDGGDVEMQE